MNLLQSRWMPLNVSKSDYDKVSIISSKEGISIKIMKTKKNNIENEIDISWKKQDIENRAILRLIIEIYITMFVINIALRSNNDSGQIYDGFIETNYSDSRSLLRFKLMTDYIIDKHLKKATYFRLTLVHYSKWNHKHFWGINRRKSISKNLKS